MFAVETVPVPISKPQILKGILWNRTSVLVKKLATMPLWKSMYLYMWLASRKVDHTAKGCDSMQWVAEAQERMELLTFVNTVTNFKIT
jgi:hypothetical protein